MDHHGATARFRELYDGEAVRLVGYVARRLVDPTAAPDVVADVFTVAWPVLMTFRRASHEFDAARG